MFPFRRKDARYSKPAFRSCITDYILCNGGYTAVDYNTEDNSAGESYEVTIEFVSGSTTDIKITNLWDGGKTINAKYDSKTGKYHSNQTGHFVPC